MKTLCSFFSRRVKTPLRRRRSAQGQTLVEYALIISFIVVVTIAILVQTGTTLRGLYSTIGSQVSRANPGSG